jgi:hypothetical protein
MVSELRVGTVPTEKRQWGSTVLPSISVGLSYAVSDETEETADRRDLDGDSFCALCAAGSTVGSISCQRNKKK